MDVFDYIKYFGNRRMGPFYTIMFPDNSSTERFRIYMLPEDQRVDLHSIPVNKNEVLVYGQSNSMWAELFSDGHEWYVEGPWINEFNRLAKQLKRDYISAEKLKRNLMKDKLTKAETNATAIFLSYLKAGE